MGSISRTSRCERFITEFNEDAKKGWQIHAPNIEAWSLGQSDGETVHMFYKLKDTKGETYELMLESPMFFDPETIDNDDIIDNVRDVFDMPRATAEERLRKAELLR